MRSPTVIASALLLLAACGSPAETEHETTVPATPRYVVVGQSDTDRMDGTPSYFVVIDPVDLSTDGFKQDVKLILHELARTHGDADFVAKIWDNQLAAEDYIAETSLGNESCDIDRECPLHPRRQEITKDRWRVVERRLVAEYAGGVWNPNAGGYYTIGWYPRLSESAKRAEESARYRGWERWKPGI